MSESKVLYDHIGSGYNSTRRADPYLTEKLFELLSPVNHGLYIDIGCGTGNYTIALAGKGLDFYGVEPSEEMLKIARSQNDDIKWLNGKSENIPAEDVQFDGAVGTLTIHHWSDLEKAFKEIYRVLKKDSRLILFTATPEQMKGYWLNHYFPVMLDHSIIQMPSFYNIRHAVGKAGFAITNTEKYFIQDDLKDLFLYSGKNKPELYFDEEVRKGISSFSALANREEVEQGLSQLQNDIEHKKFDGIKSSFENDLGDYLFIVLQKC